MKILVGKDVGSYTFDAAAKTITFAGLGTVNLNQVILITNSTDQTIIYNFASSALGGTLASNVLTLTYDTTSMDDADDLQILFEYGEPQIDFALALNKVQEQSPLWARFTDSEVLVTEQDLTAAYANYGSEINMQGFTHLGIFLIADTNDSEDVYLKALGLKESGGDTYEIDGLSEKTLWSSVGTDFYKYYEFDVGAVPLIQLQAFATTPGTTVGDLTISITKTWRP